MKNANFIHLGASFAAFVPILILFLHRALINTINVYAERDGGKESTDMKEDGRRAAP